MTGLGVLSRINCTRTTSIAFLEGFSRTKGHSKNICNFLCSVPVRQAGPSPKLSKLGLRPYISLRWATDFKPHTSRYCPDESHFLWTISPAPEKRIRTLTPGGIITKCYPSGLHIAGNLHGLTTFCPLPATKPYPSVSSTHSYLDLLWNLEH